MGEMRAPDLPSHIPSLDGVRGIAILLVVVGHIAFTVNAPAFLELPGISSLGNVGVRLFFVISGFLITALLLRDIDRHGRIRLRDFYVRRALRIFPAMFAYIAVIWCAYLAGAVDLTWRSMSRQHDASAITNLLYAVTFTQNYNHDYNWYFNHLWSLAVEEQFYLLWPFALFFLGTRRALFTGAAVIVLAPLVRLLMHRYGGGPEIAMSREFQAVADALATGCIAAMLHNRLSASPAYPRLLRTFGLVVAGALVVAGYGLAFASRPAAYIVGGTLSNIGMVLFLQYIIRNPDTLFGRLCNWKPLVGVGILSYSLYLWQEPFLYYAATTWPQSFPQNVVFAFAAAAASYFLVERPFLALKKRFAAPPPPPSAAATVAQAP